MTDNREFWDSYADEWSRNVDTNADIQRNEFMFPAFVEFVGTVRDKKLIEIGCGEGGYARHYATQGNDVTAVDYSQAMIDIARIKSAGIAGIRFVCDDMRSLQQIRDGEYDIALAPMCLMDCASLQQAFGQIARTLHPGGLLFASVLHPCFFTVSARWEIADGTVLSRKVAHYFATEPQLVNWTNSTLPDRELVESYHHPHRLEHYFNAALAVGLQLVRIEEPPIPQDYLDRNGRRHEAWARHAALILLIEFTKP